jgi:phytoene dehydrogenase-like protein
MSPSSSADATANGLSSAETENDLSSIYDAIVIGSGIGGLTCGAFLARAGMRVCVLERHAKIGGYAHGFRRRAYAFESGIHSVPMGKGGVIDHLLSLLGVADHIETIELPEMYHMTTPSFSFTMPSRKNDIHASLYQAFPHERQNLDRLFAEFKRFEESIIAPLYSWESRYTEEDRSFVSQFHNQSYEQFISRWLGDELLRQVFYGQWPYGGGSPDFGGALFYAMMFVLHYRDGTHSLKGGFKTLADALAGVITANGGVVRTRSAVTGLATEGRIVRSALLADGEEIWARLVVSNISPYQLHEQLLADNSRSKRFLRRLTNLQPSVSAFVVYCGLKESARSILPHNTTFWYSSLDNEAIFQAINQDRHKTFDHFICLRSPEETSASTLTMLYFLNKSYSSDWKKDKPAWTERMLTHAEKLFPGLRDCIDLVESGSPDTFERYTANTCGALYGFENTKNIYGEAKLPISTHLDNLYQTGHWGKPGCGVLNVMLNGYQTYHTILKNHQQGVQAPYYQD